MSRALSPMYLSTIADETTFRKLASMLDAIAFASKCLPCTGRPVQQHSLLNKDPRCTQLISWWCNCPLMVRQVEHSSQAEGPSWLYAGIDGGDIVH